MDTVKLRKTELFARICGSDTQYLGQNQYPPFGRIVLTCLIAGIPRDFDSALGYVVQIRKQRGIYGSDQYLIRHSDGRLLVHENQSFFLVPHELSNEALSLFALTPASEDEGLDEYTIKDEQPETGYIIEYQADKPSCKAERPYLTAVQTGVRDVYLSMGIVDIAE